VTTTLYAYERVTGERVTDRTMALKLRRGGKNRRYPHSKELLVFGAEICRLGEPRRRVEPLLEAMLDTLSASRSDERIDVQLQRQVELEWQQSLSEWR
jgi:serine/threonine-protein kinase HipA